MTQLARQLGIVAPILQAPMNWATDARLVAAVSEAGGLGCLGPNAGARTPTADVGETGERLRVQINGVRARTAHPFAVNVPIGRGAGRAYSDCAIAVLVLIREVLPAEAIISRTMDEARRIAARLPALIGAAT